MRRTFNGRQAVMDVIRFGVACAFVAFGHPYLGVFIAMIYIEMRMMEALWLI